MEHNHGTTQPDVVAAKVAQLEAQCQAYEDALDALALQVEQLRQTVVTICHLFDEKMKAPTYRELEAKDRGTKHA